MLRAKPINCCYALASKVIGICACEMVRVFALKMKSGGPTNGIMTAHRAVRQWRGGGRELRLRRGPTHVEVTVHGIEHDARAATVDVTA